MEKEAYKKIIAYVDHNPIATLSTINSDGSPHGAVIYVCAAESQPIAYFVTKHQTQKFQNLRSRDQVSLTIVNPSENSTLQTSGRAFEVQDAATIDKVMEMITHKHTSAKEWLPPIAKLRAGAYEVVGIEILYARLAQFQGMTIGNEHIFTGGKV